MVCVPASYNSSKDTYTLLYFKEITNRDLLYTVLNVRKLCSMSCGNLGELGGNGYMYICLAMSLCCSPETIISIVNLLYPNPNKKLNK